MQLGQFEIQKKDGFYYTGLVLLATSYILFAIIDMKFISMSLDELVPFFIHHALSTIYVITLFARRYETNTKVFSSMPHNIILLLLGNVNAYSLNKDISIFFTSAPWLSVFLVVINIALLVFSFLNSTKTSVLNYLLVAIISAGALFNFYESIYLLKLYPLGVMAFFLFGISLHAFIPLWFLIMLIKIIRRYLKTSKTYWRSILVGILTPLTFFIIFLSVWIGTNKTINTVYHNSLKPFQENVLPKWVAVSQELSPNFITERVLKSELIYSISNHDFGLMPSGVNELRMHDPLVVISSFFFQPVKLGSSEKIQILKSVFNKRHQTERRLWSGDNLSTKDIVTNVQFFPKHRIAYTEKILKISNDQNNQWRWQTTQEAIYSFYLPEGSVVTSASLWIDGVEQKSYLTSKAKATKAYNTIVGWERRDPMVLHWREGNSVSIRVFPCTPQEDRQFKIGVTTPLKYENNRLIYNNIDFEGPDWTNAKESINIVSEDEMVDFSSNLGFTDEGTEWTFSGKYKSNWDISIKAPELSKTPFVFNGNSYFLNEYQPKQTAFSYDEVYLDINMEWSKREFNKIWELVKDKKVYAYSNRLVELTESNRMGVFRKLRNLNFSLFPVYKVENNERAIIISKSGQLTPTIRDLKSSEFYTDLEIFMTKYDYPIRLFHLGDEPSPYLKALREMRLVNYDTGDLDNLLAMISEEKFNAPDVDKQSVVIPPSNTIIKKVTQKTGNTGNTPDHLLRLFAYNDIMEKLGRNYLHDADSLLLEEAKEAYVVTPFSSLITLKTQKDYDRFDIEKSNNSLKNASIKSHGAVPEPHEWLLIFMVIGVFTFLWFKRV